MYGKSIYKDITHVRESDLIRVMRKIKDILDAPALDLHMLEVGMGKFDYVSSHIAYATCKPKSYIEKNEEITGAEELSELGIWLVYNLPQDKPKLVSKAFGDYIKRFA